MSFFDKNGISSTEATSLANQNAERVRQIDMELEGFSSTSTYLHRDNTKFVMHQANIDEGRILDLLGEKAHLNEFSAWLREAVSQKESALRALRNMVFEEPPLKPKESPVTEAQILSELSVKDKAEYYGLEACASVYGKALHGDGLIPSWQKDCAKSGVSDFGDRILECPLDQRNTNEVNSIANKVFQLHRDANKALNRIKARIQKETNARNAEINKRNAIIELENSATLRSARDRFESERLEMIREKAALKIAIPNKYKDLVSSEG